MERLFLSLLAMIEIVLIAWHMQVPILPRQTEYQFQYDGVSDELRRKAEAGDAQAEFELGVWLASDNDDLISEEPFVWLLRAAERGHAGAQNEVGLAYLNGKWGVTRDARTAAMWFGRSAEGGDEVGQFNLAQLLRDGVGVTRNERESVKFYRASAVKGYGAAQFSLYLALREGVGHWRDPINAQRAKNAAKRNYFTAENFVKFNFESGEGRYPLMQLLTTVPRDGYREEARWIRCVALSLDADGGINLMQSLAKLTNNVNDGFETASDDDGEVGALSSAVDWGDPKLHFSLFRIAALLGDPIAQMDVSRRYSEGMGVKKDLGEAEYWARRAERNPLKKSFPTDCQN